MTMEGLIETWRREFGTLPVDAADIVNNPRVLAAFAAALPWPAEHLTPHMVGRRIERVMGAAVMKLPTARNIAQKWSLKQ
jgi:hypothetical protein